MHCLFHHYHEVRCKAEFCVIRFLRKEIPALTGYKEYMNQTGFYHYWQEWVSSQNLLAGLIVQQHTMLTAQ